MDFITYESKAKKIMFCAVCGRQIFKGSVSTKETAPFRGSVFNGPTSLICGDCSKDLDENGLFPEERWI